MIALALTAFLEFSTQDARSRPQQIPNPSAPQEKKPVGIPPETTARIRIAVDRALEFLAKKQNEEPDGCFPRYDADKYAPVGVTALCALAFLGSGNAGRGPYSQQALAAIDYLLSKSEQTDSKTLGYIHADGDPHSQMHGHGYATLALAEAYGMYESKRGKLAGENLQKKLNAAVRRIEASQGESGGWYYSAERVIQHEGSVTITLVQALRASRNAGITVNKDVIEKAVAYVRKLQKPDGSFRYQIGTEDSTPALTAAAISTLNATGEYDGAQIDQGMDFLMREFQKREKALNRIAQTEAFPEYSRLYIAQALYHYRERKPWIDWFLQTQEELLDTQKKDGSWASGEFGSIYVTAVNCLILEIAFDYLPIFQR